MNPVQVTLWNCFWLINCLTYWSHKKTCMRHNTREVIQICSSILRQIIGLIQLGMRWGNSLPSSYWWGLWRSHCWVQFSIMLIKPCNRYQSILRFLHFGENSQFDLNDPDCDRLYKVRPLVDHFVSKFKSTYIPEKEISVEEELLERLVFKQHIPLMQARFGKKMWSLCDNSGCLWNSNVYLGKAPDRHAADRQLVNRSGSSGAVVPRLMENLLDKGYHVDVDNRYTSEALFTYLSEHDTAACGIARKKQLELPATFTTPNLPQVEYRLRRHENMLAVHFNDKKEIYFLSTIHKANVINTSL